MFDLQREEKPKTHLEGNMLPVINMTFLLLLFFIVVGNFSEKLNQDIYPPQSVSEALTEAAVVELELTRQGALLWQGEVTTVPAWAQGFRAEGLTVPRKVRLRADGRVPATLFLPILEDLKALQVARVALVTVNEGKAF
tara:strand:+ start:2935 stop:3351 length:417 start_codon:yes stop_codon:yes gene_type:complete